VPGLLQTPQVARTVIELGYPGQSADEIERKIALRMTRQEILTRPDAPSLWAVFEEASLWRLNKNSVMREQIQHLIVMAELPNVSIQLIPMYSGAHVGVGGPFTILRFPHADLPDIVYLEQLTSAVYLDKNEDVQRYLRVMHRLCTEAAAPLRLSPYLTTHSKNYNRYQAHKLAHAAPDSTTQANGQPVAATTGNLRARAPACGRYR
jgi:hypothetical protein